MGIRAGAAVPITLRRALHLRCARRPFLACRIVAFVIGFRQGQALSHHRLSLARCDIRGLEARRPRGWFRDHIPQLWDDAVSRLLDRPERFRADFTTAVPQYPAAGFLELSDTTTVLTN